MNEKQETTADIIAEYRSDADAMDKGKLYQPTTQYLRMLLDRIESAWKREHGNASAMREALEHVDKLAREFAVGNYYVSDFPKMLIDAIRAALTSPPRNCDVGTAEEQAKRFQDFCDDSQVNEDYTSMCARCTLRREKHCELSWAQMPYEATKKGETNGSK